MNIINFLLILFYLKILFILLKYRTHVILLKLNFCFPAERTTWGLLSVKQKITNKMEITPSTPNAINMLCQLPALSKRLPKVGAIIGATPAITTSNEKTLPLLSFSNKSFTIARPITTPAQPPMACRKRITHNPSIVEIHIMEKEVSVKISNDIIIGFFLPK